MNPLLSNPWVRACKKYLHDLDPAAYSMETDELMDRLASFFLNQKDAERFIATISRMYSAGYSKATKDIQDQLKKENIKLKIINPETKNQAQGQI